MAKEFGDRRIRANSIAPGAIRTELGGGLSDEFEAHLASATALGRVGEPEEIGGVIASLLSDDNRWINAQSIEVSGGSTSDARPWPLAGQRSRVLDRIHSAVGVGPRRAAVPPQALQAVARQTLPGFRWPQGGIPVHHRPNALEHSCSKNATPAVVVDLDRAEQYVLPHEQ